MRKRDRDEIYTSKYEYGYKGFNYDMRCYHSKKYEIGKIFKEMKALICEYGIHYCKRISDVFNYYSPGEPNRYSKIRARILKRKNMSLVSSHNKKVTTSLFVEKELSIYDIVYNIFFEELNKLKEINYDEKVSNISEDHSGITIGNFGDVKHYKTVVSSNVGSGTYINSGSNNIGICSHKHSISALDNTRDSIGITQGRESIASTKDGINDMVICRGDESRAYVGDNSYHSIAVTTGYKSCVDSTASDDRNIILCGFGLRNIAKGRKGNWIILVERAADSSNIINIRSARIDGENLKENTYYTLHNGKFIEIL